MEEALKSLNITAKVLARRSNAMWDILFPTEEAAKSLAGNILITKSVRLQSEYMGRRKIKATLHGVPLFISEYHLRYFFLLVWRISRGISGKGQVRHCHW